MCVTCNQVLNDTQSAAFFFSRKIQLNWHDDKLYRLKLNIKEAWWAESKCSVANKSTNREEWKSVPNMLLTICCIKYRYAVKNEDDETEKKKFFLASKYGVEAIRKCRSEKNVTKKYGNLEQTLFEMIKCARQKWKLKEQNDSEWRHFVTNLKH